MGLPALRAIKARSAGSPLAQDAVDDDLAVMGLNDVVGDRQTQPRPLRLGGKEGIKHAFQGFRRNPAAGILDGQFDPRGTVGQADPQRPARFHRLEGIQ